ncbi:MAG: ankyrin repeat domain-containing protein [Acidobacteria bacterium]|nr:ankyrin repeat domain-containing protein [Acidobacteriota bacterium]
MSERGTSAARIALACVCCSALLLALVAVRAAAAAAPPEAPLADAAKRADWAAVRTLLQQGADVDARQGDGSTALHWASYRNNGKIAALLIGAGADVDAANDLGVTALWAACENGSADMVETLLAAGADPNTPLPFGETPLMTAARSGNADVVGRLLAAGADVDTATEAGAYGEQTALMWAVAQQHPAVVDVLLAHGADVYARSTTFTETVKTISTYANYGLQCVPRDECYITEVRSGGFTPLLFAARVGDLASARLLLAAGADVNEATPDGSSALAVAALSGNGAVGALLLEHGADPNAAGGGYAPLHAAILQRDPDLSEALLAAGADPDARVSASTRYTRDSADFFFPPWYVGAPAFWLAARHREAGIMRLLARHGADPHATHDPQYWTRDRGTAAGRMWVEEGETTALMAAVGLGGRDPLWAVDHRARVGEATELGLGPDRAATQAATLAAVRVAVELGVDVDAANARGRTAVSAARINGFDEVAAFLVEHGARR